jgi:hypothetical protein
MDRSSIEAAERGAEVAGMNLPQIAAGSLAILAAAIHGVVGEASS